MKIKLNLVKKKDHFFLNHIYNENVLKKKFFNEKKISINEHFKWYQINKKKNIIFIAKLKINIGYVRFTQKKKHWYISIAIDKNCQRKGYGSEILNRSLKKFKNDSFKIISEIKKNNITSLNFFKKNNFNYYYSNKKKIMLSYNGKK
jgi:L-amino acid N-acyltransferase YncA